MHPLPDNDSDHAETSVQQYGDWYTGSYWYSWYSEEGPGQAAPPSPLPLYQM